MHHARNQECVRNTEALGNRIQTSLRVEFHILAGIQNVEPAYPQGYCGRENQHAQIEAAGYGDPCGSRGNTQCETEKEMRPMRKPLGVRIEKKNPESRRSKL